MLGRVRDIGWGCRVGGTRREWLRRAWLAAACLHWRQLGWFASQSQQRAQLEPSWTPSKLREMAAEAREDSFPKCDSQNNVFLNPKLFRLTGWFIPSPIDRARHVRSCAGAAAVSVLYRPAGRASELRPTTAMLGC